MILKLILSLAAFSFPHLFRARRTIRVRRHRRNGRWVKRHQRTIIAAVERTPAPHTPVRTRVPGPARSTDLDPYAWMDNLPGEPLYQTEEIDDYEDDHVRVRRYREVMKLPPGAKVTHAPRFATEYWGDDGNGNAVWTTVHPDGSLDVKKVTFKRKRGR